ncbi:MAG: ABC transporter ATP-binding protein [Gammaproteobacteria bacterium]|nr:ABC transporter ATP-binding protein [Gammaproteobacteria bacterium]
MTENSTNQNQSACLVQVSNLSVSFKTVASVTHAVKNVSFDIHQGETLAIVGESGSGKSVSALSIIQLLPYPTAYHPTGSITYDGQELLGAKRNVLETYRGDKIGMIFQEPQTSLNPLHTISKQISESLILHRGMSKTDARDRSLELLEMVKIRNARQRLDAYPHQLSGGQRQRVMIAMALANEPGLLIADEPTTALDVTIQAEILELLLDLQQQLGMSMLLISHDLNIVRKLADRICVMRNGKFVETGTKNQIFDSPEHDYTKMLLAAEPSGSGGKPTETASVVAELDSLRVWYPIRRGVLRRVVDHVKAVDDVNITIRAGETVGVVGESGSGKTSLALAMLRLISSRGSIRFLGNEIQGRTTKELRNLRKSMQIVFQDPYSSLSPRMTVADIIAEGLKVHHREMSKSDRDDRVVEVLREVELDVNTRHRYPHEFSGGQRQRIAIARAMILKPRFVVLDEPTSALDRSVQSQIIELLRNLQEAHALAYIFISHDLSVVRAMSSSVVVMQFGRVVEQGATEQIYNNPREPYTKALISAAMDLETSDVEYEHID